MEVHKLVIAEVAKEKKLTYGLVQAVRDSQCKITVKAIKEGLNMKVRWMYFGTFSVNPKRVLELNKKKNAGVI